MNSLQERGASKSEERVAAVYHLPKQDDGVPLLFKPLGGDMLALLDETDHRNSGSRINGAGRALIVETDIAASDRRVKNAASFGQATDRLAQLPKDFGRVRVAEIEVV